ncbi:hypothetical protein [Chlorobium sp. KB01]|uniref:hypothetical protein n=1 Tax=Chlorobium sp. KB01 TaxID=1917528 RepID=UPI0009783A96|nr:hypothetical protein [Chlorobium sp. KB01]
MQSIKKTTREKTLTILGEERCPGNKKSIGRVGVVQKTKGKNSGQKGCLGSKKIMRSLNSNSPDKPKQSVESELSLPILKKMSVNIQMSQTIQFESVEDKNGFI